MADILVVDDEADIRDLLTDILEDEGHATREASDADGALGAIDMKAPDLVVLDIWLQGSRMDGIEILKSVKRDNPDIPVVIISGHGNIEIAVAAVKQGAYDFIEKPFNTDQLMMVVTRALETSHLRRENASLRSSETKSARIVGESPAMVQMRTKLDRVAGTGSRILLTGPQGSGKEVAARYIHENSERASGAFVVLNAATVQSDHMIATLFGRQRDDGSVEPGMFEKAHGGTLFIDEVADMPTEAQAKILRVLVDQSYVRLGGTDQVRVDVRVISASNKDLRALIKEAKFREDLFHRLGVVQIDVPPLAARREDIPALSEHFVDRLAQREGLNPREVSEDALAMLQTREWPGNVRQLRNVIEQALILGGDNGGPIEPEELVGNGTEDTDSSDVNVGAMFATLPLREARELFERDYLVTQINRFGGNISRTAAFVGMERSALHRKLKSLGVITTNRGGARVAVIGDEEEGDVQGETIGA